MGPFFWGDFKADPRADPRFLSAPHLLRLPLPSPRLSRPCLSPPGGNLGEMLSFGQQIVLALALFCDVANGAAANGVLGRFLGS